MFAKSVGSTSDVTDNISAQYIRGVPAQFWNEFNFSNTMVKILLGDEIVQNPTKSMNRTLMKRMFNLGEDGQSILLSSLDVIYYEGQFIHDTYGNKVRLIDCNHNEPVYCPRCDFCNGLPFGDTSAQVKVYNGHRFLFCWAEGVTIYIDTPEIRISSKFISLDTGELKTESLPPGFVSEAISIAQVKSVKATFLDAPCGNGKTCLARAAVSEFPSIMIIVAQQTLATFYANQFARDLPFEILDYRFIDLSKLNSKDHPYVVICLPSMNKLPIEYYLGDNVHKLIILDEAAQIRRYIFAI